MVYDPALEKCGDFDSQKLCVRVGRIRLPNTALDAIASPLHSSHAGTAWVYDLIMALHKGAASNAGP